MLGVSTYRSLLQLLPLSPTRARPTRAGNQRPVVTAVPLRPPVVAADAALAPLEADALRHGALLAHYTAAAADAKDGDEAAELEAAVAQAQVGVEAAAAGLGTGGGAGNGPACMMRVCCKPRLPRLLVAPLPVGHPLSLVARSWRRAAPRRARAGPQLACLPAAHSSTALLPPPLPRSLTSPPQLEADRIALRLIQKLLAADRAARAWEAVGTLHNMPALEGALKLASHHRCARGSCARRARSAWPASRPAGRPALLLPASAVRCRPTCAPHHL